MDSTSLTSCSHVQPLCNPESLERLSRAALAVFSSANRPVIGIGKEGVPKCLHVDCAFPAAHDLFVCARCVHIACHHPFKQSFHELHTGNNTNSNSNSVDYYHEHSKKISSNNAQNNNKDSKQKSHMYQHYLERKEKENESHAIFLSIDYAHLYCVLCDDFVFNQYLDAAIGLQLTKARAYRNKFTTNLSKLDPPVCLDPSSMVTLSTPTAKNKLKSKKRISIADKDEANNKVIKKKPRLQIYGQWINTESEIRKIGANCHLFSNNKNCHIVSNNYNNKPSIRAPVGLLNLGNSCYMNSVLQAFLNAPPLRNFFLADLHKQICNRDCKYSHCFACAIERLICDSCFVLEARAYARQNGTTGNNISFLPVPFLVPNHILDIIWKNVSELAKYEQHDAHEFFIHALNLLNEHSKIKELTSNSNDNLTNSNSKYTNDDSDDDGQNSSAMGYIENEGDNDNTFMQDLPIKPATSIVQSLFKGTLQSDVICRKCGNSSSTPEKFFDIPLHVDKPGSRPVATSRRGRSSSASDANNSSNSGSGPGRHGGSNAGNSASGGAGGRSGRHEGKGRTWSPKTENLKDKDKDSLMNGHSNMDGNNSTKNGNYVNSLRECLNRFTEPEMLGVGCEMHCSACGCKQESMKQMSIRTLPPIICFHFKRFKQSFANIRRSEMVKIHTSVEFPADGLDLSKFQTSEILKRRYQSRNPQLSEASKSELQVRESDHAIYDLFAVVNHAGQLDIGHYTALVRKEGLWFRCDDEKVTPDKDIPNVISSEEAYLVFYVQRCINIQFTKSNYA